MNRGAEALRQWIDRRELTVTEAAEELGVTKGCLSNWLAGRRVPGRDKAVFIQGRAGIGVAEWRLKPVSKNGKRLSDENISSEPTRK